MGTIIPKRPMPHSCPNKASPGFWVYFVRSDAVVISSTEDPKIVVIPFISDHITWLFVLCGIVRERLCPLK